jgi:hypothetical protein
MIEGFYEFCSIPFREFRWGDFFETEIEIKNHEIELVIFPSFIKRCINTALDNLERVTIAILKEAEIDRFHNSFGHKVIDKI